MASSSIARIENDISVIKMASPSIVRVEDDYDRYSSDGSVEVITSKMHSLAPGTFNDPINHITEDLPDIEHDRIIPKVIIPDYLWNEFEDANTWQETFIVSANVGGLLIGKSGKHVRELKCQWDTVLSLNPCPDNQDLLLLSVSGPTKYREFVTKWISDHSKLRRAKTAVGNPNKLKRRLPIGASTSVQIRCLYGLKEFFVTAKDKEYESYVCMQEELDRDYLNIRGLRTKLCDPVTVGTVAILQHHCGFARAIVAKVIPAIPQQAFCFLLDHGTFAIVPIASLLKIKSKFMKVAFQAIHVNWAYAMPLYNDVPDLHILRTFFSSNQILAYPVRMQTCCRASVVFIDCVTENQTTRFVDILVTACASGLYTLSLLCLQSKRQMWVNHTKEAYYSCPYSKVDYDRLIKYFPEDEYFNSALRRIGPETWYTREGDKNLGKSRSAGTTGSTSTKTTEPVGRSGKSYLRQRNEKDGNPQDKIKKKKKLKTNLKVHFP